MNTLQPQPNTPTDADLELLSAYIDNQLSVAERVGLEERLRAEPLLRAELAELRTTTELLRDLEPVRLPRSFTLDPATAPRRARFFPFAWVLQFSSGLAGMALVLLASVQLLAAPNMAPVAFESVPAPMQAQGEAGDLSVEAVPAATMAPAEAMRLQETAAVPEASMSTAEDSAVQDDAAAQAPLPSGGGTAAMEAVPAPAAEPGIDSATTAEAYAPPDEQATKAAPTLAPGLPPTLTLALGVVLLIAAAGTFLYGRMQR